MRWSRGHNAALTIHMGTADMSIRRVSLAVFVCLIAVAPLRAEDAPASKLAVQSGDKIAFLGDSITANGARPHGYVTLVVEGLKSEGLEVSHIPAGKSGHRSNDMLARLDRDVLSKQPQWLALSCGVNDVWHFKLRLGKRTFQGVPLEDFKKNIAAIIDQAQAAGLKVMVLTATMIGEDPERELNKMLIPYNTYLRQVAREKHCLLADLNADMQAALKAMPDEEGRAKMFGEPDYQRHIKNKLTVDGCHMNHLGNIMMAKGVLRAFGLSEAKITDLAALWQPKQKAAKSGDRSKK
jgi:lysophospholipase L1-like esterase